MEACSGTGYKQQADKRVRWNGTIGSSSLDPARCLLLVRRLPDLIDLPQSYCTFSSTVIVALAFHSSPTTTVAVAYIHR